MPQWQSETWFAITGWVFFVFALAKAIQAAYSAERDRNALRSAETERTKLALEIDQLRNLLESAGLQREKLTLEVQRLRNSPEAVADRRAIYDRLRSLLAEITQTAAPTLVELRAMHGIVHDSAFAFPQDLTKRLEALKGVSRF